LLVRLPLLGDLLGLPIPDNTVTAASDPRLRQEALFSLAIELIQAWASAQPMLLLIEDIHGMDEASAKLTLATRADATLIPLPACRTGYLFTVAATGSDRFLICSSPLRMQAHFWPKWASDSRPQPIDPQPDTW